MPRLSILIRRTCHIALRAEMRSSKMFGSTIAAGYRVSSWERRPWRTIPPCTSTPRRWLQQFRRNRTARWRSRWGAHWNYHNAWIERRAVQAQSEVNMEKNQVVLSSGCRCLLIMIAGKWVYLTVHVQPKNATLSSYNILFSCLRAIAVIVASSNDEGNS